MGSSGINTGGTAGVQEGHTAPGLNLPPTSSRKSQQLPNMALAQLVIASLVSTCAVVNGQSADYNPLYIGKFEDLTHSVKGDIFVLDEKTIYIQVGIGLKNTKHKNNTKSNGLQLHDTAVIRPTEIL